MTISGYANIEGPKPIGVPSKIWNWARTYARHQAFCHEYFEGRADIVIEQSKLLHTETTLGALESLDICMQVEAEFPGRIEEFIDRAGDHPNGRIYGLMQYVTYIRNNG